jgi:hypothetical protein
MKRLALNGGPPLIAGGLGWALTGNVILGLTLAVAIITGRLIAAWRARPREVRR